MRDAGEFLCVFIFSQPASCNWKSVVCGVIICLHSGLHISGSRKMRNAGFGADWINFWYFSFSHPATRKLQNAGCRIINKLPILFLIPHPATLILIVLFPFTLIWRFVLFLRNYKYDILIYDFSLFFYYFNLLCSMILPPYFTARFR